MSHLPYRIVVAVVLVLAGSSAGVPALSSAEAVHAPGASVPIDPRVLQDTAGGSSGRFLVVLREQAAASRAASQAPTRAAQAGAVYDALRYAAQASQASPAAELAALNARSRPLYIVNVLAVEGNRSAVEAMAARADVLRIASDRAFRVPLETPAVAIPANASPAGEAPAAGPEWNIVQTGAPKLWAAGVRGQGILYANADTGVQWTHPALKTQYAGWNGSGADHDYAWWDAVHDQINPSPGTNPCGYDAAAPCDDYGHGTHTMGTGIGDDGIGDQIGMAPGARWMACRNMERGWGRPSSYLECLQFFLAPWDHAHGPPNAQGVPARRPDVVSNSYVCTPAEGCSDPALIDAAVDNLRAAGIFVVASAGNDGPNCSTVDQAPGVAASALAVGAVDKSGNIAGFSSRGPVTSDGSGRRKPELSAPGVSVRSSYPPNTWTELSGTSMAAPHVAGAVALLWSAYPDLRRDIDRTTQVLEQSAVPYTSSQGCGGDSAAQVPNNVYGYGQLDVVTAYALANQPPTPTPVLSERAWLPLLRQ